MPAAPCCSESEASLQAGACLLASLGVLVPLFQALADINASLDSAAVQLGAGVALAVLSAGWLCRPRPAAAVSVLLSVTLLGIGAAGLGVPTLALVVPVVCAQVWHVRRLRAPHPVQKEFREYAPNAT